MLKDLFQWDLYDQDLWFTHPNSACLTNKTDLNLERHHWHDGNSAQDKDYELAFLYWFLHCRNQDKYRNRKFAVINTARKLPSCLCACSVVLCDPLDCGPPGSNVHGVSRQKYCSGAICYARGSYSSRDQTQVPGMCCTAGIFFTAQPPWQRVHFTLKK